MGITYATGMSLTLIIYQFQGSKSGAFKNTRYQGSQFIIHFEFQGIFSSPNPPSTFTWLDDGITFLYKKDHFLIKHSLYMFYITNGLKALTCIRPINAKRGIYKPQEQLLGCQVRVCALPPYQC